jgi:hypothetical protein
MHDVQAPAGTNLLVQLNQHTELSTPSTRNHACVLTYSQIFSNVPALIASSLGASSACLPDTGRMWAAADSAQ